MKQIIVGSLSGLFYIIMPWYDDFLKLVSSTVGLGHEIGNWPEIWADFFCKIPSWWAILHFQYSFWNFLTFRLKIARITTTLHGKKIQNNLKHSANGLDTVRRTDFLSYWISLCIWCTVIRSKVEKAGTLLLHWLD